jgi:hypothetical protein
MTIAEEYNRSSLFLILLKAYYHFHPLFQADDSSFVDNIDRDNSLDIFEMFVRIDELAKELVDWELLIF